MSGGWQRWVVPVVLTLGCGALAFAFATPAEYQGLALLGLYTVPSHTFVSPFPHEPVLLFYARTHGAWACAWASMFGALVAAMIDYVAVKPLLHRPGVRSKYVDLKLYRKSQHWFDKAPFWTIVVTGLTPIPFYPFKFLALAAEYPAARYMTALVVGRTPRYWALAFLGYSLQPPNWSLVLLTLVIVGLAYKNRHAVKEIREGEREQGDASVEAGASSEV